MNDTVVGLALHHLASALIPPLGHSQCLTMPPFNVHYNSGGIKTCVFHRTISAQSSLQERGKKIWSHTFASSRLLYLQGHFVLFVLKPWQPLKKPCSYQCHISQEKKEWPTIVTLFSRGDIQETLQSILGKTTPLLQYFLTCIVCIAALFIQMTCNISEEHATVA